MSDAIETPETKKEVIQVNIEIDWTSHDKAARRLSRVGAVDGDAFVKYGESIKLTLKKGIPLNTVYLHDLSNGLHQFAEVKALYGPINAFEFSEFAEEKLDMSTSGLNRSFYKPLYTMMRRKGEKKMTFDALRQAIIDARSMTYPQFRETYFPKAEKSTEESSTVETVVDGVDCFEASASHDLATVADCVEMARTVAQLAIQYGGESAFNAVLDAVCKVNDETFGNPADVEENAVALENPAEIVAA